MPHLAGPPGTGVTGNCGLPTWVLGTEFRSSGRTASAPNMSSLSPALPFCFETGSRYVALSGLELTEVCLPLPPSCGGLKECASTLSAGFLKIK